MTLHKNAYFCAKLQKKVDLGELGDIIIGIGIVGAALWGSVITPLLEHVQKGQGKPAAQKGAKAAPRPKRSAPAPRAQAQERKQADFRPWEPSSAAEFPTGVDTRVSPFITGEEGVRSTVDVNADEGITDGAAATGAPESAGCDSDDLRRGIIWAEILRPKYKD